MKIVAVSGGFDPVHIGHVRLFKAARKLGDKLVVILNNDNWIEAKKNKAFMPEAERKEILLALEAVDDVVLTDHKPNDEDMSSSRTLKEVGPNIFANGGDRTEGKVPEDKICEEIGCEMIYNVGGEKIQSSSELVAKSK